MLPTFGEEARVVGLQNEDADLQFAYDDAGNVLAETGEHGTVGYTYDADGRLVALETPWGDRIEYVYDEDGRVSSVADWDGRVVALTYAPDGTLETIRRPNGLTETHRYAQVGRLEQAEVVNEAGRVVSRQGYSYDLCERLTGITDQSGTGTAARESLRMEYDAEGRLLKESSGATGVPLAVYGYDANGNMTACNRSPIPVGRMDEPQAFAGASIRYDANGNMTLLPDGAGGNLHCRFAANGTLREVETYPLTGYNQTNQNQTWEYEYDGLSRRTAKTNGVTTWRYGWAQHQLLWEEVQTTPDALPIRRDYLWLPDSVTPIAFRENGRAFWLQADARDSIIRAFDEAGNVVWSARYDSFGQAEVQVNRVRQAWRLPGQYADEETGLHYNLARYYSPHIKSYLSRDPQWHEFGASNYSYCLNDPWNRADPFGAFAPLLLALGAIAVGAVVGGVVAAVTGGDPIAGAVGGALTTAGAIVGFMVGGPAGALVGGVVGSAAGAFTESVIEQARHGGEICWKCAAKSAAIAAAIDVALLGLSKIPGVQRLTRAIGAKLFRSSALKNALVEQKGLKSLYSRASKFRKNVRNTVFNAAKNEKGEVFDPYLKKIHIKSTDKWHMGHKEGYEFRKLQQVAEKYKLTRKQFLDAMNDPKVYQPQTAESNLSHKFEAPDNVNEWEEYFRKKGIIK